MRGRRVFVIVVVSNDPSCFSLLYKTVTHEEFALKSIEKKKADSLAKRQHPNMYNEIAMERRILSERLTVSENDPVSKRIIKLYHSFQDYNSLYFLVELHLQGGDLWSKLRYKGKMVGKY